jgi:hypothetical protein
VASKIHGYRRWLGSEEGFSFAVGDKPAEAPVGVAVIGIVSRLPELSREAVEDRFGVVGVLSDYQDVRDLPSCSWKFVSKHLQKVSFLGLPADD